MWIKYRSILVNSEKLDDIYINKETKNLNATVNTMSGERIYTFAYNKEYNIDKLYAKLVEALTTNKVLFDINKQLDCKLYAD